MACCSARIVGGEDPMRTQERANDPTSFTASRWPSLEPSAAVSTSPRPSTPTVAQMSAPLIEALLGSHPPVCFEFWDRSTLGPANAAGSVLVRAPEALR